MCVLVCMYMCVFVCCVFRSLLLSQEEISRLSDHVAGLEQLLLTTGAERDHLTVTCKEQVRRDAARVQHLTNEDGVCVCRLYT